MGRKQYNGYSRFLTNGGYMMALLIIIIVALLAFGIFRHFRNKANFKFLTEDEFIKGYRKAQLIDVREPQEFDSGHILGARNIPVTQLKQRLVEIRKDKPVYLYCQGSARATRAANILRRKGYKNISLLEGGFKKWTGKIKTKN